MILRRDKQLGWMLMPAQKMYQQMDFAKAQQQSGAAPDDQVEITQVGSEIGRGLRRHQVQDAHEGRQRRRLHLDHAATASR